MIHPDSFFDTSHVPFSTFGSWMSLRIPSGKEDLYVRNHYQRNTSRNCFAIIPILDGERVPVVAKTTPSKLEMAHEGGLVEVCFESPETIRLRGRGLDLQLGQGNLIYSEGDNDSPRPRFTINIPEVRRYQVEVLRGTFEIKTVNDSFSPNIVFLYGDEKGAWEIAIDEYNSTWIPRDRPGFDTAASGTASRFAAFLKALPGVRPSEEKTLELAAYVDWASTVNPSGLIKRPSILMSKNWMENVWSWDHCFNAMALAHGHPSLAVDQMLTMVDQQDEFGCYPDSFSATTRHYTFSKPPVHGWAWSYILKHATTKPVRGVQKTLYRSLCAQVEWWLSHRVASGEGQVAGGRGHIGGNSAVLPYYLHGNDSGWDNSTMFREGVPLIAPDLSALLVVQMDTLSGMAGALGYPEEAKAWTSRANALFERLMQVLWQDDHFVARLGLTGKVVESRSLIPHIPIILGQRLPMEVREHLRGHIESHLTEWGLSTERIDSPLYSDDGYWTGPIWAPPTVLAVDGLSRCGFDDLADEIAVRFCRLCAKSGFAENFDARTGAPLRDRAYTWTSSGFMLMAHRLAQATL